MSNQAAIRPYEMSVWTLRDTFLASLRVPGIENKGQIEEPKMRLNTDGTQELSFKIPMYMYDWVTLEKKVEPENEEEPKFISTPAFKKIENPRWYDVKHGLLMVGLRKIKVIFNKGTADEDIYEFLVTDITEEHADDNSLYCNVNCSGLAFQELGKKGYNISLSADTYYLDYDEVIEQREEAKTEKDKPELPINNINYWCDKVFKNSDWEYSIQMDWATYDGFILHRFFKDDIQLPDGTVTINPNTPYIGYIGKDPENSVTVYISSAYTGTAKLNDAIVVDVTKVNETTGEFPNATYPFVQERFITYTELLESERDALNYAREKYGLRRNDKIYEDDYTASWDISDDNILTPTHYEKFKEKRRMVESNESNIYNATQAIAEAFGVYCQYKYHYDNNYHIIKKEVIFYNDFMDELHGIIDLSYNYDVSSITRTLDSNDICTKLIVRSVDDDTSPSGKLSIMNTPANKTGENYLLNFDYLYQTGSIEKDQYEAIPKFELEVKKLNKKLITLEESKMRYEREINEYEATIAIEKPSIAAANEQVEKAYAGLFEITKNESGLIKILPKMGILLQDDDGYYINISTKGVVQTSIQIYKECQLNTPTKGTEITNFKCVTDNSGNIIKINGFLPADVKDLNHLYLVYDYQPDLYYQNIINTFSQRAVQSQQALEEAQDKLEIAQTAYDEAVEERDNTLEQKQELIADFEKMMGPALREGTWQPDTYDDYGDYRASDFEFTSTVDGSEKDNYIELKWDDEPFDEEQLGYYKLDVNTNQTYYPCIKLDDDLLSDIKDYLNNEDLNYKLQFKYDEVLLGAAIFDNELNKWTQMVDNKTYTDESLDKLESQILFYALKKEGYIDSTASSYDINTLGDAIENNLRSAYQLRRISHHFFTLGSEMVVGYLKKNNNIIPVLVLLGAENLLTELGENNEVISDTSKLLINPMLCTSEIRPLHEIQYTIKSNEQDANQETRTLTNYTNLQFRQIINKIAPLTETNFIMDYSTDYTYVYPRLYIQDMSLKTSEDQLKLSIVNNNNGTTIKNLQNYYDYNLLARDDGYYITIEGQRLIENGNFDTTIHVDYVMSNAELNIYLDALEVMQSSAFPQVSYSVTVSMLNEKFMHKAYRHLNRIAHINDFELKFENVLGYIAELNLDLDHPWEDTIDVKNYKTKFEDLFTKIVASTEQMKANATVYNKAAAAFNFAGGIKSGTLNDALSATSLSLAFTKGNLTIDDKEGIRAESQDGIVMMNGGGIFCATEKNNSGDWIWNSGILPTGINASLLKAGTIDTNLIRIYAGDNLRFQMNANGLYAYRAKDADEADQEQYVVHNSDGLFLIAEAGTKPVVSKILTKSVQLKSDNTKQFNWPVYDDQENFTTVQVEYDTPLENDVQRVEVSWDGLKLRNWEGQETFYADPDTGDLIIGGTLLQNTSYITVPTNVMNDINEDIPSEDSTNDTTPKNSLLMNNIRLLSEGSNSGQVKELSNNDYHSLTDYVINELVNDAIRLQAATTEEEKKTVEQNVRFLTPKVAAVKIGNYINWSASSISNEILRDALDAGGRIDNRIQEVKTTLQTNINNNYIPILSSLTNMVNGDIGSGNSFPQNPQKYQAIKLTADYNYNNILYFADHTYWWDGETWVELLNKNINLSTNQELNLFGAKATFATDSELKMLAGGKLHLFGGEVFISSQKDINTVDTIKIGEGAEEKTIITTSTTNGIVMDDNGLAIYSTKNITIGTQRVDANQQSYVAGLEIDGSTGSFSIVTDAITDADTTNNKEDPYKDAGINFYRINGNRQKVDAITINGNGIAIKTDAKIDIESTNFRVHSTPTGNQPIFYVGADDGFIKYGKENGENKLTIKGIISAESMILGSNNTLTGYINGQISSSIQANGTIQQYVSGIKEELQAQIDGEIDTWFYKGPPYNTENQKRFMAELEGQLNLQYDNDENGYNADSIAIIKRHLSDIYYDIAKPSESATAGRAWRLIDTSENNEFSYEWQEIAETATTAALAAAATAQSTADGKITTYTGNGAPTNNNPANPSNGDLYIDSGNSNKLYRYNVNQWAAVDDRRISTLTTDMNNAKNNINKIINGETNYTFSGDAISSFVMNKNDGFKIQGVKKNGHGTYFKVTSGAMGFFDIDNDNKETALMYYENGSAYFTGDIYIGGNFYKIENNSRTSLGTIDNYLSTTAQDKARNILNDALQINGINGATINGVITERLNIITDDYTKNIKQISNILKVSDNNGESFPSNPEQFDTFTPTQDIGPDYKEGYKYVYVNDDWELLESPNLFFGTNGQINMYSGSAFNLYNGGNMTIASGGNITIAAGGNMTIGSTSTNEEEATLSLLSTGKLTAYGAEEVIIATGNESNKGSYLWMHDVDTGEKDEQQQTIYEKKLDIGTTGDFQILSGGSFKAIAAKDVLIATSAPDNNNEITGSYLWMHDVGNSKKLDIGTTGDFTIGSGGNFTVDSGNINMTTSNFALNVVDKENPDVALMSMIATGSEGFETFYAKEIVSDSIIPVYTGPTTITISNSILDNQGKQIEGYYNTLSSALSNLNNTYIMQDITISYANEQDHVEEQEIIIEGIMGTGKVIINGVYEKTTTDENDNEIKNIIPTMIHNDIRITTCTAQIELQHFDVQPLSIATEDTRHNLIEIERSSSVIINNCNLFGGKQIPDNLNTSTNNDIVLDKNLVGEVLIYIKTSQVEINSTTFQSADYGIVQISGSTRMFDCTGNIVYSVHIEKSILFCDKLPGGTTQCILSGQIFAQSSMTGTATAASNTATASTVVTTTETITKSFKAAVIKSARGGSWDSSAKTNKVIDVMQGCYDTNGSTDSKPSSRWWYGCMWFNLSDIFNKLESNKELQITACSLKLKRQGSGGKKAARPLYLKYYPGQTGFIATDASPKSYNAVYTNAVSIQNFGAANGLAWNASGTFTINPDNIIDAINNSKTYSTDNTFCLILCEPLTNTFTGDWSTGYSRYYGLVSGYEPTLILTYQIVDKQS